jgi:hypothetical protein
MKSLAWISNGMQENSFYYQFVSFVFYRFLSVRIETGILQKGREREEKDTVSHNAPGFIGQYCNFKFFFSFHSIK